MAYPSQCPTKSGVKGKSQTRKQFVEPKPINMTENRPVRWVGWAMRLGVGVAGGEREREVI